MALFLIEFELSNIQNDMIIIMVISILCQNVTKCLVGEHIFVSARPIGMAVDYVFVLVRV